MKIGIRGKLFGVSVGLIIVVGGATAIIAESQLRGWLLSQLDERLTHQARAVPALLGGSADGTVDLDALADRLGQAFDSRITIIAANGVVLGDSGVAAQALGELENHAQRPEVIAALAGGIGRAERRSATLGPHHRYVAIRFDTPTGSWVARAAYPLSEIEAAVTTLRRLLLIAVVVGLIIAVVMSGLASHLMVRTFRHLVERVRGVARGAPGTRVPVPSSDELGSLARSVNRMSDHIGSTVGALEAERARLQAVLEGMPEAVIALDQHRRVELVNGTAVNLLGLPEAPAGRSLAELIRVPEVIDLIASASADPGRVVEFGFGDGRTLLAQATPQRAGGVVLVVHEITRLRRLETMRRDFVANVSHELRNPVSIIRTTAETLVDGALDDPAHARGFAEAILRNSERLSQLIDDLLDLARIESGEVSLALGPLELEPLVRRVFADRKAQAIARDVRLVSELAAAGAHPTGRVIGDASALEQVLANLVDNAIKYGRVGGQVLVRAERTGPRVRVEVVDDGPGIAPIHRDRLFERFYRVDAGRSRALGGTGLGLAIVKHLAGVMGGSVGMEPVPSGGSVFWVELPAA